MSNAELISYIDLTSLNTTDSAADISALCEKATTPQGDVAAVCIFGQFVSQAKAALANQKIRIASVANFPQGTQRLKTTGLEIEKLLSAGADEIDVVIDYTAFIQGNKKCISQLVHTCKSIMPDHTLKVILETGELKTVSLIDYASQAAIEAGADFLKTSTGKVPVNATLEAADIMLHAIAKTHPKVGFKAAGGVKTPEQAIAYKDLAIKHLGQDWLNPKHFRIGASSLLDSLL